MLTYMAILNEKNMLEEKDHLKYAIPRRRRSRYDNIGTHANIQVRCVCATVCKRVETRSSGR